MLPIMFHGYRGAKDNITDLDNFRFWFTMSKALAPLRNEDETAMLPYILSPRGFFPDMGVKLLVEKLPEIGLAVRRFREKGWTCGERNVCLTILASITSLWVICARS
jgi:hypothetical protein